MRNKLKLLISECTHMKFEFWIPILIIIGLIAYGRQMVALSEYDLLLDNIQFLATPVAVWWILYSFYYYVEDEGAEVYFTYSISRKYLGIGRICFFYSIYIVLISFLLLSCNQLKVQFLLPLCIQGYILCTFSFFCILSFRSIVLSLGSIVIYVFANMLNPSLANSFFSIYFNYSIDMKLQDVIIKSIILFIAGTYLLLKAQYKLDHFQFIK